LNGGYRGPRAGLSSDLKGTSCGQKGGGRKSAMEAVETNPRRESERAVPCRRFSKQHNFIIKGDKEETRKTTS